MISKIIVNLPLPLFQIGIYSSGFSPVLRLALHCGHSVAGSLTKIPQAGQNIWAPPPDLGWGEILVDGAGLAKGFFGLTPELEELEDKTVTANKKNLERSRVFKSEQSSL
jgi:hypothetical protein